MRKRFTHASNLQIWHTPKNLHFKTGTEFMKINRNDPCPCGSSKKYKKCCGGPNKFKEPPAELPPPNFKGPNQHSRVSLAAKSRLAAI